MKKIIILIAATVFFTVTTFAQSKFDNWPEMKEYHAILSQTFHPAEGGDLRPIKKRSHEMLAHIKLVNASPKPQEYDNDAMKKALKKLEKESDKLNAIIVRQEQDVTIMKQLNIVHNAFHDIVGMCGKDEKKEK